MTVRLVLGRQDAERFEFGSSPGAEALRSLHVLAAVKRHPLHISWVLEMRTRLDARLRSDLDAFRFWFAERPLLLPEIWQPGEVNAWPDDLDLLRKAPVEHFAEPMVHAALAHRGRARRMPLEHFRGDAEAQQRALGQVEIAHPASAAVLRELIGDPEGVRDRFADFLAAYWDACLAADWPGLETHIHSEIARRFQALSRLGPAGMLADLSDHITATGHVLAGNNIPTKGRTLASNDIATTTDHALADIPTKDRASTGSGIATTDHALASDKIPAKDRAPANSSIATTDRALASDHIAMPDRSTSASHPSTAAASTSTAGAASAASATATAAFPEHTITIRPPGIRGAADPIDLALTEHDRVLLVPSHFMWPELAVTVQRDRGTTTVVLAYALAGMARQGQAPVPAEDLLALLRAAADTTRLQILELLARRSRSTRELAGLIGLTEAAVSKHLKVLHKAGWIAAERHSYYVYYRLEPGARARVISGLDRALGQNSEGA